MGDILKYRFPGKKSVHQKGKFICLDSITNYRGFFISSFDKSQLFGFVESDIDEKIFYNTDKPICYSNDEYLSIAKSFLLEIKNLDLSKAILSRIEKYSEKLNPEALYNLLKKAYPTAFVYLVSSPLFGTWIGASPEVLLKDVEGITSVLSLAGTKMADDDSLWGSKEKLEQQYVSDFVLNKLKIENVKNLVLDGPKDTIAGPVKHLGTQFTFDSQKDSAELINKLHPTPAVSGLPQDKALELINKHEKHERLLYAGIIGVLSDESNLYVNLRCSQIQDDAYYLYLGGGFTNASIIENEWKETKNKAKTLLNIIEKI